MCSWIIFFVSSTEPLLTKINSEFWIFKIFSHLFTSLFIFPSYEGGGAVVAEALSHSIPVIINSEGGAVEIVNDSASS